MMSTKNKTTKKPSAAADKTAPDVRNLADPLDAIDILEAERDRYLAALKQINKLLPQAVSSAQNIAQAAIEGEGGKIERDYEPELAWGTPDDFRKHRQYGGTRENY